MSETTLSAEVEAALDELTLRAIHSVESDADVHGDPDERDYHLAEVRRMDATLRTALERLARIEAERDTAHDAIRWALGEGDSDFGDDPHNGAFWWRKPLRDKAGLVWSAGRCRSVTPDELLDRAALNDREDG
jgi:hypothetical protein